LNAFGATVPREIARTVDLRGRLAVLTGASSGIGVETARGLALAGADVVLGVRDVAAGEAVARALAPESKGELRVVALDLRELDSVAAFADAITGPVDLLIANAACPRPPTHLANADAVSATRALLHWPCDCTSRWRARIVVVSPPRKVRRYLDAAVAAVSTSRWPTPSRRAPTSFCAEAPPLGADGIFANAVLPGSALAGLQPRRG
jgi:NAD(P)-dependent dehydrogenase (short-subunit alcohol dehydrogenase family)